LRRYPSDLRGYMVIKMIIIQTKDKTLEIEIIGSHAVFKIKDAYGSKDIDLSLSDLRTLRDLISKYIDNVDSRILSTSEIVKSDSASVRTEPANVQQDVPLPPIFDSNMQNLQKETSEIINELKDKKLEKDEKITFY